MEKRVEAERGGTPGEAEGARRATGASPGAAEPLGPGQRWSVGRRRTVALRLLRGEPVDAVSRELGVPIFRLEPWREAALRTKEGTPGAGRAGRRPEAHRGAHHGKRALAREVRSPGPFGPAEVETMSASTSPTTGRRYGVQRVCAAWDVPRSSFYQHPGRTAASETPTPQRRGPKPTICRRGALGRHRQGPGAFAKGEGHRKVWARLWILRGLRVARKRVLRLMREHGRLSPHRRRTRGASAHDGRITSDAPNVLWGTDGARVFTVEDDWVWLFAAVEHWNAECVGVHVCKKGDRFAALQPIAMGLTKIYGSVDTDVARGLSLRMDHGTRVPGRRLPPPAPSLGNHPRASPSSPSLRPTAWPSASTAPSKNRSSTAAPFPTSKRSAPPSPTSSTPTTTTGASKNSASSRRSRRANNTPYPWPPKTTLCPKNRVRYTG